MTMLMRNAELIAQHSVAGFWEFCMEREAIRIRKEVDKLPPPWSVDTTLQKFHFCNVRREDDRGTLWYVNEVLPVADNATDLLWRTVLYRAVNNISWFEEIGATVFGMD